MGAVSQDGQTGALCGLLIGFTSLVCPYNTPVGLDAQGTFFTHLYGTWTGKAGMRQGQTSIISLLSSLSLCHPLRPCHMTPWVPVPSEHGDIRIVRSNTQYLASPRRNFAMEKVPKTQVEMKRLLMTQPQKSWDVTSTLSFKWLRPEQVQGVGRSGVDLMVFGIRVREGKESMAAIQKRSTTLPLFYELDFCNRHLCPF